MVVPGWSAFAGNCGWCHLRSSHPDSLRAGDGDGDGGDSLRAAGEQIHPIGSWGPPLSSFTFFGLYCSCVGWCGCQLRPKGLSAAQIMTPLDRPCSIRVPTRPTRSMNTETAPLTASSPQVCATTTSKFALSDGGITMVGQTRFLESRQIGNGKSACGK